MNLTDAFTAHAARQPYAVAIISGEHVVHYGTLERMIWQAAGLLHRAGVRKGDAVGLSMRHSTLFIVTALALGRLGAAHFAVPPTDPRPLRAGYARRLGLRGLAVGPEAPGLSGLPSISLSHASLRASDPRAARAHRVEDADDLVFSIRRTSGTTGDPKGAGFTHRQWVEIEKQQDYLFPDTGRDRFLALVDMNVLYGHNQVNRTLYYGGTVVLTPFPFTPQGVFGLIDRYRITRLATTPNVFPALLEALPAAANRFPTLRDVTVTGMAMQESLRREVRRRFSRALNVKYASNEAGFITCANAELQKRYPETVGAPVKGIDVEVVDEEGRPAAPGVQGRVRARSPWMPKSYFNAAPDGVTFRDGWVYLGDVGHFNEDGMLFVGGRADDLMNHGAVKIAPADIEGALLRHPAVAEAAAFPLDSPREQQLPVAAVTLKGKATAGELLEFCRARLGKRAPVQVYVVKSMPRNAAGKILKRELAKRAQPPAAAPAPTSSGPVPPRPSPAAPRRRKTRGR